MAFGRFLDATFILESDCDEYTLGGDCTRNVFKTGKKL
jgi:hypothetical protein